MRNEISFLRANMVPMKHFQKEIGELKDAV